MINIAPVALHLNAMEITDTVLNEEKDSLKDEEDDEGENKAEINGISNERCIALL